MATAEMQMVNERRQNTSSSDARRSMEGQGRVRMMAERSTYLTFDARFLWSRFVPVVPIKLAKEVATVLLLRLHRLSSGVACVAVRWRRGRSGLY